MLSDADVAYVQANFVPLDELCRRQGRELERVHAHIAAGRLPRPSYTLDDAVEMVPPDYFALADAAGGVDRLRSDFVERYAAAAAVEPWPLDDPDLEWEGYLSGEYGVCLHEVTPENVARKSALVLCIERLLSDPYPSDREWREQLGSAVDELHLLEREFAGFDRIRFGGPTSRDRLITEPRRRYSWLGNSKVAAT